MTEPAVPNTSQLGRNQRRLLFDMMSNGNRWPDPWHMTYTVRQVMDSLRRRGLVERVAGVWQVVAHPTADGFRRVGGESSAES